MSSVQEMNVFDAQVFVSEQLNRLMMNAAQELAIRAVDYCGSTYGFDAEEARRNMNLMSLKLARKAPIREKQVKMAKEKQARPAFPLPYSGECNPNWCNALRQNCGLYTQCQSAKMKNGDYCKTCNTLMQKSGSEFPEYGTIQQRQAVGIFEYVDPKGRKPISYAKIMKKYKQDKDSVIAEAAKFGQVVDEGHFVVVEEVKRGRKPAAEKSAKAGGKKGRPKKSKVVIQIEGEDEDLFATLVASANEDEEVVVPNQSKAEKEAKRAQEKAEKEAKLAAEKAEKEAKRAQEKAEKEAKLAAEKAEKEAKKEAERLAREEKKKAEEAAKAEREAQRLKEKEEREAKKKAEAESKTSKPKSKKQVEEDEEPDVVKSIKFEDKKYLRSEKSGLIYDYEKGKAGDFVVIGKWENDKIVFNSAEESEDEYDD